MTARPNKKARKLISAVKASSEPKSCVVTMRPPAEAPPVALLRTAKGSRPEFYEDPAVDQLFAIVTALTAEISVAFDRIDTLVRLLEGQGVLTAEGVESYQPNPDAAATRARHREELIQRAFAVFESSGPRRTR